VGIPGQRRKSADRAHIPKGSIMSASPLPASTRWPHDSPYQAIKSPTVYVDLLLPPRAAGAPKRDWSHRSGLRGKMHVATMRDADPSTPKIGSCPVPTKVPTNGVSDGDLS
jgi:hypothetical protein